MVRASKSGSVTVLTPVRTASSLRWMTTSNNGLAAVWTFSSDLEDTTQKVMEATRLLKIVGMGQIPQVVGLEKLSILRAWAVYWASVTRSTDDGRGLTKE